MCLTLRNCTIHEKEQTLQPWVTEVRGAPGSCVPVHVSHLVPAFLPQIVLSAVVCLRAAFHYPASVSVPLQDWPHLNMPRHHLLLNGPLWSKCQTEKLLKKKCSHLLSWHFPLRPIPLLLAFFPLLFLLPLGRSRNKGACSSLIKHTLYCKHTHVLTVCMCVYFTFSHFNHHFEPKMSHIYFRTALKCHVALIGIWVGQRYGWGVQRTDLSHPLPQSSRA